MVRRTVTTVWCTGLGTTLLIGFERTTVIPAIERIPVRTIKLSGAPSNLGQRGKLPVRVKPVEFSFSDAVAPAPHDFVDLNGKTIARKSAAVRVLNGSHPVKRPKGPQAR